MRILVAIDGSPYSDLALNRVASRPWAAGSELKLVTVINPIPVVGSEVWALPPEYYDDVTSAAREAGDKVLAAGRERLAGLAEGLAVTTELLTGPTAQTLVDEATRWNADLVVLGSHGYGAVKRFLLGSVSHAVALHAPCSVEIIRDSMAA